MTVTGKKDMATQLEANALLRSASRLIEQAMLKLEVSEIPCRCCGRPTWSNKAHAKIYEMLHGQPRKLVVAAEQLEDGRDQEPTRGYPESLVDFHKGAER